MPLDTIIDAVAGILETVDGVGRVHDFVPYVANVAVFRSLFKDEDSGSLLAWTITRTDTDSNERAVHSDEDLHTVLVRGYMSLNNDKKTEKTFQLLIEAIRATFRANRKLNFNAVNNCFWSKPMKAAPVTHGTFGGVLCHYCELRLVVQEYPITF